MHTVKSFDWLDYDAMHMWLTDSFLPAGNQSVLKKQTNKETSEAKIYRAMSGDAVQTVIPKFYREVELNNEGISSLIIAVC